MDKVTHVQMQSAAPMNADRHHVAVEEAERAWRDTWLATLHHMAPAVFVGGEWHQGRAERIVETLDPSTGEPIGQYLCAGPEVVDNAVRAAAGAQPEWAGIGLRRRAEHVARLRERVEAHRDELAALDAIDGGLPLASAEADVDESLQQLHDWPGLALSCRGDTFPLEDGMLHYTTHAPYGVVARIIPFNHPLYFAATTVLPPLLAGNTVVLKPAEQTPMSALRLGELAREALPPGVLNIVTGGRETGESLVTHPLVRRIAFTGSTATGLAIQRAAARDRVRTVSLELGGKNPLIIFPDVVLDSAVNAVVDGMSFCGTQGQSCGSTSRVFVHRDLYEAFVDGLAERLRDLRVGPAYARGTDVGPLISARQAARVQTFIASGNSDGARIVVGGDRVLGPGFFIAPTLFTNVTMQMKIAREEIFGPVVCVLPWDDPVQVIEQANSVPYGLTASVWTNDLGAALTMVNALNAGYVWVNDVAAHYWGTPFGGWGDSGLGREESIEELASYLQTKAVHVRPRPLP
jgi:betaine-aldehyde dehydrogenase